MVIREILDSGAIAVVTRDSEFEQTLNSLAKKPSLVITDSQAFAAIAKLTPKDIRLTSFQFLWQGIRACLTLPQRVQKL